MTLRPPGKPASDLWRKSPAGVLDYEIAQETASALGRHGRALEAALKDLADFDAADRQQQTSDRATRAALVAAAAHALWQFIVQREACGLRDVGMVVRMYRVPAEVQHRMGAFPPRRR
jgi:uncharacterized protein DUF6665